MTLRNNLELRAADNDAACEYLHKKFVVHQYTSEESILCRVCIEDRMSVC